MLEERRSGRLESYRSSPVDVEEHVGIEIRLREGGYNDRQVYELIQNAADAAAETQVPARIELVLTADALYAANTGAPLTQEGISFLLASHLSHKTHRPGDQIGRFGLGFKSLLAISSRPEIHSQTVSIRFDEQESRQAIETALGNLGRQPTPVMRLAWPVDTAKELVRDPVLGELCLWATTIVKLPLRTGDIADRTASALKDFPPEFMLFLDSSAQLTLEDRRMGWSRKCRVRPEDDDLLLDVEGELQKWRIYTRRVPVEGAEVIADAGSLHLRDQLPLTWAVPLDTRRGRDIATFRFWAFFPLTERSRLPGIMNAPWKTNDDRTGMLRGRFNDFLLDRMGELVASSLDGLSSGDDPGRILDFLPRRDLGGDTAARLADAVWKLVASRKIVPDCDGVLKPAADLSPHPEGVEPSLLERWVKLAPAEVRQRFVHPTVQSRDRLPRYRVLLRTAGKEEDAQDIDVGSWLEAIFAPTTNVAREVVHLATEIHDATKDVEDRASIKAAKVILLRSGEAGGGRWQAVYFSVDRDVPQAIPTVASELEADPDVKASLQRVFDVRPFDAEAWAEELGKFLLPPFDWPTVWSELHRAPRDVIARVLEAAKKAGQQVCVRSANGAWRAVDEVLLTGTIVLQHEAKDNAAFVVDDVFHADERSVLERIGFGEVPSPRRIRPDCSGLRALLSPYERAAARQYYKTLSHHQRPHWNRLNVLDRASLSQPAGLLKEGTEQVRTRLSTWLLTNAQSEIQEMLLYGHDSTNSSVRDRYPIASIPNRLTWLLLEYGRLILAGCVIPLNDCIATLDQPWNELLAVEDSVRKGLSAVHASLPAAWRPSAPPATSALWAILAVRALDGDVSELVRQQLYIYMGEAGVVPEQVAVGESTGPIASLYVATDEMLASSARRSGLFVLGLSPKATKTFVDAGAHELKGEPVPAFDFAEHAVPFEEAFWHLGAVLTDEQILRPLPDVIFSRKLRIEYEASGLAQRVHVDRSIWLVEDRLYVDDGVALDNSLTEGLAREILRLLTAERYLVGGNVEELQRLAQLQAVMRQRRAVAAGADLPARLLLAVRGEVDRLLVHFVTELRDAITAGGYEDRRVAELFLSTFGIDALRELRDDLAAAGLDPPGRWGSSATVQFVESLGFPGEFATSTAGARDPFEIVNGPNPLKPLHAYQVELHRELVEILSGSGGQSQRAMLSLPTGAGKTRVAVEAVVSAVLRTSHARPLVLWVAQRDELCEQAVRCFQHVWQNNGEQAVDLRISRLWGAAGGRVAEGDSASPHVVVATIQTLNNRFHGDTIEWLAHAGAVIIDEAHQGITPTYTQLLQWLSQVDVGTRSEPPIVGLSATPFRGQNEAESRRLARRFQYRLLPGADEQRVLYERLRREGVLARVSHETLNIDTPFSFDPQELSEIATFNEVPSSALVRLARDTDRNDRILECLLALRPDSKVLFFANSVEHAQLIAGRLNLAGRRAAAVVGETRQGLRQQFIDQFQRAGLNILTTHTVLATGFDAPKVDTIVISRPTFSPVLYQQMIGRGLRGPRNGGKATCRLITVLDNLDRFGDRLAFHEFVDLWRTEPIG